MYFYPEFARIEKEGWGGKEVRMLDAKLVADLITGSRGLLGLLIVWLGITQGEKVLSTIALLMLLDWTGDFIDGSIAHCSRHPRRTWLGDSDIYIDMFVSLCLGIYLLAAKFITPAIGFWYMLTWVLTLWRFGLDKNPLMVLQAPIYLWFILMTLRLIPGTGFWLVIWVATATLINWRRFSREMVPKFIEYMISMWHGRHI
jgi:hypothetical protein